MQQRQMQYHGIASYTFEYKLSTDSNWTTAPTQNTNNGSCDYTCEGLTGGKSYNLRVIVTDRAGNSGTGTNTATTTKPEKNPGGDIDDITSEPPGEEFYNNLDFTRCGTLIDIRNTQKKATYLPDYGASKTTVQFNQSTWILMMENDEYYFAACRGPAVTFRFSLRFAKRLWYFG